MITNVIMKGRAVHRRITERLVTACEDGVDGYLATSVAGWSGHEVDVPIHALWGCCAEPLPRQGDRTFTELAFPRVLHADEKHYFASEAIDENLELDRDWVNVEIDHHGIAAGLLAHGGVPIRGLVMRVLFDNTELPEACWWYAKQTERERGIRPPDGDEHLLPITGYAIEHTFAERCQPQENYGIAFWWSGPPRPRLVVSSSADNDGESYDFDVAISFAGADRAVASKINKVLCAAGFRVFYDFAQQSRLLGAELAEYLHDVYLRRSRYAIVVGSADYLRSKWARNWEWRAILARMQSQDETYVLPYLIEDVSLPGLNPTIGFASVARFRPSEFARLVVQKLMMRPEGRRVFSDRSDLP